MKIQGKVELPKIQNLSGNKLIKGMIRSKINLSCHVPSTSIQYHTIVLSKQKTYKLFLYYFSFHLL
jgi:hypothetical protein